MKRFCVILIFSFLFSVAPLMAQGGAALRQAQGAPQQAQDDGQRHGELRRTMTQPPYIDENTLPLHIDTGEQAVIPFSGIAMLMQNADSVQVDAAVKAPVSPSLSDRPKEKSPGKAFFYSILLPGAGQYYTESSNSAVLFLGAEALLWLGLVGNNMYADHLVDEYKAYAVQHANVLNGGKDKDYWASIGKYEDIYSYNEQRRRERRFDEVYDETDFYYWNWDSKTNRYNYDRARLQANEIADREVYFWGAIALNHLASAIHALAMARKYNKALEEEKISWNLRLESRSPVKGNGYVGLAFRARF